MPLNSSFTTSYPIRQAVTSAVPFLPSSTVAKTVNDDKQRSSTSTVSYLNYSTTIMGLQSSAPFRLSTAGRLLIWFLHFRGKIVNAPAQTNKHIWLAEFENYDNDLEYFNSGLRNICFAITTWLIPQHSSSSNKVSALSCACWLRSQNPLHALRIYQDLSSWDICKAFQHQHALNARNALVNVTHGY